LTGLPSDWVLAALERVEGWKLEHVCAELLADSVDAAAAATLLCKSLDELAWRGIPEQRWVKSCVVIRRSGRRGPKLGSPRSLRARNMREQRFGSRRAGAVDHILI
jgi:hypothetical protein